MHHNQSWPESTVSLLCDVYASSGLILIASEGRPVALAPQSQSNTSRASHKSGTRKAIKSRAFRKFLTKFAIRKLLSSEGRPVSLAPQSQSNTSRVSHTSGTRRAIKSRAFRKFPTKFAIRKAWSSEGRPVALAPQLQSNTSRASHKSGTRRAIKSRAPRKVLAKSVIKWKVLHFGLPTKGKDKGMIRKTLTTNTSIYHWESRSSKGPPNATQVPSESRPKDEVFLAGLTSLMDSIRVSSSNLPPINTETGDSVSSPRSSPRYHAPQSALTYIRSSNKDPPKTLSLTQTSKAANRHYATAAVSKNRPLSVLNILKP